MSADDEIVTILRRTANMKKLMTLMLGAGLAFGAVTAFAQGEKKETTKKTTTPKKSKKSTKEAPKG
jgi:hypothetical protein